MTPKMSPGTLREQQKTRPKTKRKINEKKGMGGLQGRARSAPELGREAGFPPNPAGSDPAGALKTL